MLGKYSADENLKYSSYFFPKIGCEISCKLSPKETICMKCQILFSMKKRKPFNLLSAEFVHSTVRVMCVFFSQHLTNYHKLLYFTFPASYFTKPTRPQILSVWQGMGLRFNTNCHIQKSSANRRKRYFQFSHGHWLVRRGRWGGKLEVCYGTMHR